MLGGDLLQASAFYQQAVTLFQKLGDRQGLVSSLATLMVIGEGGSYEVDTMVPDSTSYALSLHFGEQAIRTAREIGQSSAEVYALLAMAQYLGPHGEYARAWEVARAGLTLAEHIEHRQWLAGTHWQVGELYLDLLAFPEAGMHLEQALTLAREVGSWNWIRIVSSTLASVYVFQQNFPSAEACLTAALESDAAMQTVGQRLVWAARTDLALAGGNPAQALSIAERLIATAANLSSQHVIPRLWKLRGEALAALNQQEEAETLLLAARTTAQAQGLRPSLWRICVALDKLYTTQRRQEAEEAFSTAQTLIEELAADLSDETLRLRFLASATLLFPKKRPLTPIRAIKQA
ncbi:MAG TPA: tetratricopeptide repeat protein, partial [Ktedonobacteraceae bacterium]|nr:tetratricopeptide repeat protein [Ktedonobacteraceae bacterium]